MSGSQTYDGAGNIFEKQIGASNQFCEITAKEKAVYFLYTSHELNLCLSKASKVSEVHNMVNTMHPLGLIFKFLVKLQIILETSIAGIHSNNEETKQKVVQKEELLYERRWAERQIAFDDLFSLYETVTFWLDKTQKSNYPENTSIPLKCRIYHAGRVLLSHSFYNDHGQLDTTTQ